MSSKYLTAVYAHCIYGDHISCVGDIQLILFNVYDTEREAVQSILECLIKNNICTHKIMEDGAYKIHCRLSEPHIPFIYNATAMEEWIANISTKNELSNFIHNFTIGFIIDWNYNMREIGE